MQGSTTSDALKILVVTEDRVLQRQFAGFFATAGYTALQAADSPSARAAIAAESPQIVMIDAELAAAADWELCRQLSQRGAQATFRFLLVEDPDETQLHGALEAGIDDFLVKPVAYGELLSRIRAAARILEYDRRLSRQGRLDPVTGLLSQSAFIGHVRRQVGDHASAAGKLTCVVLDVDFFNRAARQHGEAAAEGLAQAVAQQLNQARTASEVLGRLSTDRFAVMLPGATEADGVKWAEKARETLASRSFQVADATHKLTISAGVAASEPGQRAEALLGRATEALAAAKSSGRNCVIAWSQRDADSKALVPDELFGRTAVRDVMTPATIFLQPEETAGEAVALLARTRLDGLGVVDSQGKLLGICFEADLAEVPESDYDQQTVGQVMASDFKTFVESDRLAALMEYFSGDSASMVAVVNEGRPVGFVTCNSLLALARPVQPGSLDADVEYCDTTRYLLVPDVRPLEAAASAE